jgi:hypothetical protein
MRIIKPLMVCIKGLIVSIKSKGKKPWYNIILVCGETKFNQPNLKGCLFLRQSLLEVGSESLSHTSTSPCSTFSLLEAPTLDSYSQRCHSNEGFSNESPNRACWIQQTLSTWRTGTLTVPMTTEGFSNESPNRACWMQQWLTEQSVLNWVNSDSLDRACYDMVGCIQSIIRSLIS